MNRTKFYNKVTVNDVEQLDFMDNNLSSFTPTGGFGYYRTTIIDKKRPDIISFKNYGTVYYWWLICLHNRLNNPFFDTTIDLVLEIPSLIDIFSFLKDYKKR